MDGSGKVLYMSDKIRLFSGFATLMMLIFMTGAVSAATLETDIGEYETAIYSDSTFIVPVSVTADGPGTVSITIYPTDGLSCDICVDELVFDIAGTKEILFTVSADNTGIYENPFNVEASMADSIMATDTAQSIITIDEAPIWVVDFSSDKYNISKEDSITLTLSLSVTGPIDGIVADLDYPSDDWTITSGNKTYTIGKVTGEYGLSWILSADNPEQSTDFTVTLTSTDPQGHTTRTLSIPKISQPDTSVADNVVDDKSSGNHQSLPTKISITHKPVLVPGTGLRENTRLTTALRTALGTGKMDSEAIDNMMRISASITSQIGMDRQINVSSGQSKMQTSIKYNGNKPITDFVVYDIVPKSFALSAKDITVTAPGARVEIVEDDPEFAIIFDTVSPGETLLIGYEVSAEIDANIVSSFTSEVYATGFVEEMMCAQVMTPAMDSATGDCVVYPTPCDVPEGWDVVGSCPFESTEADNISDEPAQPAESNLYKYMILLSLLGIVSMVVVLRKNKQKKYSY